VPFIAPSPPALTERRFAMYVDGQFVDGGGREEIVRISPAHGLPVSRYPVASPQDVDAAVAAARLAFDRGPWPRATGGERAAVLMKVADLIDASVEELAMLDTLEAGKPISQTRDEMRSNADWWRYAAGQARSLHGESYGNLGPKSLALLLREPIGVVGMITAWNFPFSLISQKLPFALAAGCTVVAKPSEMTSASTLRLGELLHEAGLPRGVVSILVGHGRTVGQQLAEHPDVDMMSFTGSTAVGREIIKASSGTIKKVGLELGGKNGMIVCEDAEMDEAADALVFGLLLNTGQCCQSSSRVFVQEDVHDDFLDRVVTAIGRVTYGDPLDPRTRVGAIVSEAQISRISGFVDGARADGCGIALGGKRHPEEVGLFFEPTVVTKVRHGAPISRQEVFGPVLSVLKFTSLDQAIANVNDTDYGLAGGVWSRDVNKGMRAARAIRAGVVWINAWMEGCPELPFGGYRQSGLGREGGRLGIEEYTETKTLMIKEGPRETWWAGRPETRLAG
jgi:acyl-CoA reductase-like NAD-dependent aldehyde dehydrogenase